MNELYQYAVANYEDGGHWIVETWDAADYDQLLEECGRDVIKAKRQLRVRWELICEQERDCAW